MAARQHQGCKKLKHDEIAYVKMFCKLAMAGGSNTSKSGMVVAWFWWHSEPNRPFCGWGFCLLSLNACMPTPAFCMFRKKELVEKEKRDKMPTSEESYTGGLKHRTRRAVVPTELTNPVECNLNSLTASRNTGYLFTVWLIFLKYFPVIRVS